MRYLLVLLLVFSVSSCGPNETSLAKVDGKSVTQTEFESYLKFKRLDGKDDARRSKLLDQYLERAALAAAIEKTDVLDTALINAELEEFRKQMLISRYFEKYLNDAVSEDAVKNYYSTHGADYEENQVHVAHILIRANAKMSETERKAKLTAAQEACSQIRAGKDFAEIAAQVSQDKVSAKKGGDLGWIKKGAIDAKFSQVVFELETGAVSDPFETPFGYHVVKVLEAPRTIKKPFEVVAGDIRYRLRNQAKKAELDKLTADIKVEM